MRRYRALEAESGVAFYTEAGYTLFTTDATQGAQGAHVLSRAELSAACVGLPRACDVNDGEDSLHGAYARLDAAALRSRFPLLHVPETAAGLFQRRAAGYISPRLLVHAQLTAAISLGAEHIKEDVSSNDRN